MRSTNLLTYLLTYCELSSACFVAASAGDMDDEFQRRRSVWTHSWDWTPRRHVDEPRLGDAIISEPQWPQGWETLSAQSLNDPKSGTKRDFVEAHLATLHNVVRKTITARTALRQRKALDVLQKFRDCSEFPVTFYFLTTIQHTAAFKLSFARIEIAFRSKYAVYQTSFPQIKGDSTQTV